VGAELAPAAAASESKKAAGSTLAKLRKKLHLRVPAKQDSNARMGPNFLLLPQFILRPFTSGHIFASTFLPRPQAFACMQSNQRRPYRSQRSTTGIDEPIIITQVLSEVTNGM
jgi:hypothetical protein